VDVISAVSRIEGEAGGGFPQNFVKPVPIKADPLIVIIDPGSRLLQLVEKGVIIESDPDAFQYPAPGLVDLLYIFRCKRLVE
jgi:hypothetical protein